jgi:hypothetical protein
LSFFIAFRHSFDCLLSPVTRLQLRFLSLFQFILSFTFCLLVSQSLLAYKSASCRFTISLGLLLFLDYTAHSYYYYTGQLAPLSIF